MKDYSKIDKYLNELKKDIYAQEVDEVHQQQTKAIFVNWLDALVKSGEIKNALDIGCGQGIAFPCFTEFNIDFTAITLGEDFEVVREKYPEAKVLGMDMHFLDFPDKHFDLIYSRHILEHSPMPLLALMEWHRVAKKYAVIIVPHHINVVQGGINHYYILDPTQWGVLFRRAKWEVLKEDFSDMWEYRFLLKKI